MLFTHIENLNSIDKLQSAGFVGTDASLLESLMVYDLIWAPFRDHDSEDDGRELDRVCFVFPINKGEMRFDRASYPASTDVFREWDIFLRGENARSFYDTNDLTEEAFREMPFPDQFAALVSHWGRLEIIGESYWEGFSIEGAK